MSTTSSSTPESTGSNGIADDMILIIAVPIAAGVLILIAAIVFGILANRRKSRTTRTPKSDQGVQTEIISKDKGIQTDRNANLPSSGSEEFGYASIERSSMVDEEQQVSGSNQVLPSEPNITTEDEAIEPYAEFGRSGPVFSTLPGYKNAKNVKDGSKGGDRPQALGIEHGAQTSGHRDVYTLPTRTRRGSENIEVLENTAYDMDG